MKIYSYKKNNLEKKIESFLYLIKFLLKEKINSTQLTLKLN